MRIILVILAALIVAGGTGFYVMQGLRPATTVEVAAAAPALKQVYIPAQEFSVGTIITPDRLSTMDITEGSITGQMIVADAEGAAFLTGSVARQVLPLGVPIARSAIVQPGDRGFLAAVLPKGKRAITIPIDVIAGLSGLALPGDRVDLILTYTVTGGGDSAASVRASETVIENIRVLAFDQRLGPNLTAEKEGGEAETPPVAQTATLEVSSAQAEMVTLAQTLGTLSLVLNSVRDGGDDAPDARQAKSGANPLESLVGKATAPRAPRRLTLESDVTSTTKVQVVRGVTINATPAPAAAVPTE
jgi:pilus assembly protein CpaB